MHKLQPKHSRLKPEEVKKIIEKYNISVSQLPKIKIDDSCIPENSQIGDIIKIERKIENNEYLYFRVVV